MASSTPRGGIARGRPSTLDAPKSGSASSSTVSQHRERDDWKKFFQVPATKEVGGLGLHVEQTWTVGRSDVDYDDFAEGYEGLLVDRDEIEEDYLYYPDESPGTSSTAKKANWVKNKPAKYSHLLLYSDFIPPLPPSKRRGLDPTRISDRRPENFAEKKYYDNPSAPNVRAPFPADFLGITEGGFAMIKVVDKNMLNQNYGLQEHMNQTYLKPKREQKMPFKEIDVGRIVVARMEPGPGVRDFIRARVLHVDTKERNVHVRDLDSKDTKMVPANDIYHVDAKTMRFPMGIQKCKLKGLEFWNGSNVLMEIISMLPLHNDKIKVVKCEKDDEDGMFVIEIQVTLKPRPNKWAYRELDVTLNAMMMWMIGKFTRIPRTFYRGQEIINAHIGIAEEDGTVWVQMHSLLSQKLSSLGEDLKLIMTSEEFNPPLENEENFSDVEFAYHVLDQRIFLARFFEDRVWYRVKILQLEDENAEVQYMDFGNIETIPVDDILPIDFVDPLLARIPMQVFPGYLNGIDKIVDIDGFFETLSIHVLQKICVASFKSPGVPLLDVYAQLKHGDKEFTYVNKLLLDKGIAEGKAAKNPTIPFDIAIARNKASLRSDNPTNTQ